MAAQIAIIHFIGIVLFTTHASDDGKLHAVMPRIQSTTHSAERHTSTTPVTPGLGGVVDHTAVIAYAIADERAVSGWQPKPVPGHKKHYRYVALQGELITIEPGAANDELRPDALQSKLPRLERCCERQKLQDRFRVADRSGAAAAFRLTHGTASSCTSVAQGLRIDTKLQLATAGTFVIKGTTVQGVTRTLTLRGGATVYAMNIPTAWLNDTNYAEWHEQVRHSNAYPAMLRHEGTCELAAARRVARTDFVPRGTGRCGVPAPKFRFGDSGIPTDNLALTSDCSNNTWP